MCQTLKVPVGFSPLNPEIVLQPGQFRTPPPFVLPHLVIEPVLLLQGAEVLQAQCVLVVRHHEARNRSGGQSDPIPSHLLFDIHSAALAQIT